MKILLEVVHDKNKGAVLPIRKFPFLIGRDPKCHLRAASRTISLQHCELINVDGRLHLRDLGSTNGTFLNDQRIEGEVEVFDGDLIRVGPLAFRVTIEHEVPIDAPTPLPGSRSIGQPTEEEAAALLFELDSQEAPKEDLRGSTIILPPEPESRPAPAQRPTAPPRIENSSNAAKAILEKYARRDRK